MELTYQVGLLYHRPLLTWRRLENTDEHRLVLPSGGIVLIPNFHQSFEEQREDLIRRAHRSHDIPIHHSRHRMTTRRRQQDTQTEIILSDIRALPSSGVPSRTILIMYQSRTYRSDYLCDIVTGVWSDWDDFRDIRGGLHCQVRLKEIEQIAKRQSEYDAKLQAVQKETRILRRFYDHVCERNETIDAIMKTAMEVVENEEE